METIMSTLALPGATVALATAAPGPLPRLLAAARVRQRTHIRRYLGRQSSARSVVLGFDAAEIAALGQGSLQLPTHQATPTLA
jgi:hypothetical protein